MPFREDEIERMTSEELPGPADLESALFTEQLRGAITAPPIVVEAAATIAEVLQLMRDNRRGVVLIATGKRLEGIFTERDVLLKIAGTRVDINRSPVRSFMTRNPDTLPADSSIAFALNKMVIEGYRHIPLIDESENLVGVVSMRDLIEYMAQMYQKDVLNLPPEPRAAARNREGA